MKTVDLLGIKQLDKEQRLTWLCLVLVVLLTLMDCVEDLAAGEGLLSVGLDMIGMACVAAILVYILRLRPRATRQRVRVLEDAMQSTDDDLQKWKATAATLLNGLGEKMNEQFNAWQLSNAEKQVALGLIKGLSIRELAEVRGASERTVRQQASHIYAKAHLPSRAALAGFFLEDLLLPEQHEG